MAIFASTTTSGYGDPLKAMTIKALEQRQKDLLAQQAAGPGITPENTQTPVQGFGHVFNQLGDQFRQARTDEAIAAQRAELAKSIAGYDPNSGPPPAAVATADPELYKSLLSTWAENRRAAATDATQRYSSDNTLKGTQGTNATSLETNRLTNTTSAANVAAQETGATTRQGTKIEAEKAAATEAARVAQAAADAQEKRLGQRGQSDAAKIMEDVANGKLTQEQGKALVEKLSAPSASEMKAGTELQNTHLDTQGALADLKEARTLLGPNGEGIRTGSGGGFAQTGAKWIGDRAGLSDPALTKSTERYNQIMNSEAITAMAQKLKGASTDFEMKAFVALMNDPNAEASTKIRALDNMIGKAEAHLALQQEQLKRAKVSMPGAPGGGATAAAPAATATASSMPRPAGKNDSDLIAEAKAASANATPAQKAAIDAQLQKWLMGN